jgi:hypothetical protein
LSIEHLKAPFVMPFRVFLHEKTSFMAQASVLTDTGIKRVFHIIESTRHAERNHLAFVLSIFAGLRVGAGASTCAAECEEPPPAE